MGFKENFERGKFLFPAIHSPDVRDYHGSLGNEIALINAIFSNDV